ncbi:MAG: hypothetical protein LBD24_01040 [Spirochaetaceae bacterium]|nr:hypothetical protein [Spirochaetaceae bacterium]
MCGTLETAGGWPRLSSSSSQPAHRTGCCTTLKQQAAMLKQPEAGRASTAASPLNGQGVAPFGNNRRPC